MKKLIANIFNDGILSDFPLILRTAGLSTLTASVEHSIKVSK